MNVQRIFSSTIAAGGSAEYTFKLNKLRPSSHRPFLTITGTWAVGSSASITGRAHPNAPWCELDSVSPLLFSSDTGIELPYCSDYKISVSNTTGLSPTTLTSYVRH